MTPVTCQLKVSHFEPIPAFQTQGAANWVTASDDVRTKCLNSNQTQIFVQQN